jgi:sulfite reductase alpha subunit-like flavoprotein
VQTHLPELVGRFQGQCDVYICGLSKMVKDVRRILKEELGLTKHQIHSERYD